MKNRERESIPSVKEISEEEKPLTILFQKRPGAAYSAESRES
jgi:hypothetical protein